MDAIIVAVGHKEYRDMDIKELQQYYKEVYSTTKLPKVLKKLGLQEYYNEVYSKPLLVDVKSIFDKEEAEKEYDYWRL